jgi:hypothetical protein
VRRLSPQTSNVYDTCNCAVTRSNTCALLAGTGAIAAEVRWRVGLKLA